MGNPYEDVLAALVSMGEEYATLEKRIADLEKELGGHFPSTSSFALQTPPATFAARHPALKNLYDYRKKHQEWARKILGVMSGYRREMQSAGANLRKGRLVAYTRADVTVGASEPYAKAIQHKHTVSAETSAVNQMIAKAANQLTGESGEHPLATQRRVIDVAVNDPNNLWPFEATDFGKLVTAEVDLWADPIPFSAFIARACSQIERHLGSYKRGVRGLNTQVTSALTQLDPSKQHDFRSIGQLDPHRPRASAGLVSQSGSEPVWVQGITVKIVYGEPRGFTENGIINLVRKAVFTAVGHAGGGLVVGLQQITLGNGAIQHFNFRRR
jgi:hypothetical protein